MGVHLLQRRIEHLIWWTVNGSTEHPLHWGTANKKTVKKLCRWGRGRRGKCVGGGVQNKGKRCIVDFFVLQKQRRHSFVNQDGGVSAERAHSTHNAKWYFNFPVTNPPTSG